YRLEHAGTTLVCADEDLSPSSRAPSIDDKSSYRAGAVVRLIVLQHEARTMRIAQVAPLAEAVPPKLYGGTERVVSWLTEELVETGHEVTLFASGDSITNAELEACSPEALRLDPGDRDPMLAYAVMLARIADQASCFDVMYAHIDWVHV